MPSPLGHLLLGSAIATATLPPRQSRRLVAVAACGALACAPDLDLLPHLLFAAGKGLHRGFTHAPVFALGCGALLYWALGTAQARLALSALLALLSHGIIDALTTATGRGVMLLWPFTERRWKLDLVQLPGADVSSDFAAALKSAAQVLPVELAIFVPLLLAAHYLPALAARPASRTCPVPLSSTMPE